MVEVLKDGQFAYAASSDMSLSSIQTALNKAVILATSSLDNPLYKYETESIISGKEGVKTNVRAKPFDI